MQSVTPMTRPQPAAQATPTPAPKRMTLDRVTRGRVDKPLRVLLYGTEGIGKSTFGACAPSPIFLGAEDGTAQLDVARFPEPTTWADMLDAVATLQAGGHDFKTLVVDTLDWAEPLCWAHVCAKGRKDSIEDFGFGKGYAAALDEWRVLLARLDALRVARGMHVVLLAHSWIKTFKNPEGDDFDRYEMKLHAKAGGLCKEWSDAVLFAHYETFAVEKEKRVRGVSSGARLIETTRHAAWDAKNRHSLPESLPLSWDDFAAAVAAHATDTPAHLRAQIAEVASTFDAETQAKVDAAVKAAGDDATTLARILDRARGKAALTGNGASHDSNQTKANGS